MEQTLRVGIVPPMEANLVDTFYQTWEKDLKAELRELDEQIETISNIYLDNFCKKNLLALQTNEILKALLTRREGCENEINRISEGVTADSGLVKWH